MHAWLAGMFQCCCQTAVQPAASEWPVASRCCRQPCASWHGNWTTRRRTTATARRVQSSQGRLRAERLATGQISSAVLHLIGLPSDALSGFFASSKRHEAVPLVRRPAAQRSTCPSVHLAMAGPLISAAHNNQSAHHRRETRSPLSASDRQSTRLGSARFGSVGRQCALLFWLPAASSQSLIPQATNRLP